MEPNITEPNNMTDLKNRLRREIAGTNVAVLSAADVASTTEPHTQKYLRMRDNVEKPNEKYGLRAETETTRFWSTGILEMALSMGFTVWIISTRKAVGPHDSWWTKLVPGIQTIMHGPNVSKVWMARILKHFADRIDKQSLEELEDHLKNDVVKGTYTTVPFMVWAVLAQLEWPLTTWMERDITGTGKPVMIKRTKPEYWITGLADLAAQGLIIRGPFFRDQMKDTDDAILAECKAVIRARSGHVVSEPTIRNGACINCGCASGECEC